MDCIVQGVVKSRTGLSYFHFTVRIRPTFTYHTVQVPKPQNGSGLKYGDNEKKVELEKKKKLLAGVSRRVRGGKLSKLTPEFLEEWLTASCLGLPRG